MKPKHARTLGVALILATGCGSETVDVLEGIDKTELRSCTPESPSGRLLTNEEAETFKDCQWLKGGITVRDLDLALLSSLVVIDGKISAGGYYSRPFDLEGLNSLEAVEGGIGFLADEITSFQGVAGLRVIGQGLRVAENTQLVDFQGLEGVTAMRRLEIRHNTGLKSLRGLDNVHTVTGDVIIWENPALPQSEIDAFLSRVDVGGEVEVK